MSYTKLYGECLSIRYDFYNKHILYKKCVLYFTEVIKSNVRLLVQRDQNLLIRVDLGFQRQPRRDKRRRDDGNILRKEGAGVNENGIANCKRRYSFMHLV